MEEVLTLDYMKASMAKAAVLLIYTDLIQEGGCFGIDSTAAIPAVEYFEEFNGFNFLNCTAIHEGHCTAKVLDLIREGAVIFLLCDLSDSMGMYEEDYLMHPHVQNIIKAYNDGLLDVIPETKELFALLEVPKKQLKWPEFINLNKAIYNKYVLGWFDRINPEKNSA